MIVTTDLLKNAHGKSFCRVGDHKLTVVPEAPAAVRKTYRYDAAGPFTGGLVSSLRTPPACHIGDWLPWA